MHGDRVRLSAGEGTGGTEKFSSSMRILHESAYPYLASISVASAASATTFHDPRPIFWAKVAPPTA